MGDAAFTYCFFFFFVCVCVEGEVLCLFVLPLCSLAYPQHCGSVASFREATEPQSSSHNNHSFSLFFLVTRGMDVLA